MDSHALVDTINKRIDDVAERIDSIDGKVDELLKFKWQIIGGSMVLSALFSFIISVTMSIINR